VAGSTPGRKTAQSAAAACAAAPWAWFKGGSEQPALPGAPELSTMRTMIETKSLFLALGIAISLLFSATAAEHPMKKTKLRHVVAFKFKDTASAQDIDKVVQAFAALKKQIPAIVDFEWGLNNSPEKHNKGCTHVFTLTFKSEKDRNAYLVDPAHKEFGKLVGPVLADVFVVDYWAQD
jgi:hypothetical protein